jgi:hypothetical protein
MIPRPQNRPEDEFRIDLAEIKNPTLDAAGFAQEKPQAIDFHLARIHVEHDLPTLILQDQAFVFFGPATTQAITSFYLGYRHVVYRANLDTARTARPRGRETKRSRVHRLPESREGKTDQDNKAKNSLR